MVVDFLHCASISFHWLKYCDDDHASYLWCRRPDGMYSQWQRMFIGRPIKRRMCCLFCLSGYKYKFLNRLSSILPLQYSSFWNMKHPGRRIFWSSQNDKICHWRKKTFRGPRSCFYGHYSVNFLLLIGTLLIFFLFCVFFSHSKTLILLFTS